MTRLRWVSKTVAATRPMYTVSMRSRNAGVRPPKRPEHAGPAQREEQIHGENADDEKDQDGQKGDRRNVALGHPARGVGGSDPTSATPRRRWIRNRAPLKE